jgi:hypothetical protein
MAYRLPAATARIWRPTLRRTALPFVVGWLTVASGGCFHFGAKPIDANPPTQQQLEAYAAQQTALRNNLSLPQADSAEHCEQLVAATPGVEELRINHGSVESRQWTLIADGSTPRWAFVRPKDGAPDGWAPKPGIDKLDFHPPLEPALTARSSVFLAYAPLNSQTADDSQKAAAAREEFGPAEGAFIWRGRRYSYTLTSALPCFPGPQ